MEFLDDRGRRPAVGVGPSVRLESLTDGADDLPGGPRHARRQAERFHRLFEFPHLVAAPGGVQGIRRRRAIDGLQDAGIKHGALLKEFAERPRLASRHARLEEEGGQALGHPGQHAFQGGGLAGGAADHPDPQRPAEHLRHAPGRRPAQEKHAPGAEPSGHAVDRGVHERDRRSREQTRDAGRGVG